MRRLKVNKIKKLKLNGTYNYKAAAVWIAAFAVIGVGTLLLTRAATPGIAVTVDSSLPNPTDVKAYADDRVATIAWTPVPNPANGSIVGYYVSWGSGGAYTNALQTEFNSIQIQPLTNGTLYNVKVQSVQGSEVDVPTPGAHDGEIAKEKRANGKVSTGVPVTITASGARVDQLRSQMTGFFDDFNSPAGPFDELKWNTASSTCVPPGETGAFINNQFHAHSQTRSSYGSFTYCDRGQSINRPRGIFDTTGRTEANPGVLTFDFDGVSRGRDAWYIDLIPITARKTGAPLDLTSHASIFNDDISDPTMLRIVQSAGSLQFESYADNKVPQPLNMTFINCPDFANKLSLDPNWCSGKYGSAIPGLSALPELPVDYFHAGPVPNVRRHWRVEISPTKVKFFLDSTLMLVGDMPANFAGVNKWYVQNNTFSYNTGKDDPKNPTTAMLHWDNFGWNGPAQNTVIHNYIDGGIDGLTPFIARGTLANQTGDGNRSLKINMPDPIANPVKARLMFTFGAFGYQGYTWRSGDSIVINGKTYAYDDPYINSMLPPTPTDGLAGTSKNYSDSIAINPADLRQGMNDVQLNLVHDSNTNIVNTHLELEYTKGTEPTYTQPATIFGVAKFMASIQPTMASHDKYLFSEQDFGLPSGNITGGGAAPSDTTAPTVSITSPAAASTISGSTVNVTAAASDAVGVTKVDFYVDGSTLISSDTTSPYTAVLNTTTLTNASHTISAKAYDAAGNVGPSPAVSVTVNNTVTPPPTTTQFKTLPVNANLPTEADCSARVRNTAEVRPTNAPFNATKGAGSNYYRPLVTGNYTGTTDEIIQWAACKWGLDEDIFRSQAIKETYWFQNGIGDFTTDATKCDPLYPLGSYPNQAAGQCPESVGLYQVRWTYHKSAFYSSTNEIPANLTHNAIYSTALNADYTAAAWRSCYNGEQTWLNDPGITTGTTYAAGDVWGCIGLWVSGRWRDPLALSYIADIQDKVTTKFWTDAGFLASTTNNPFKYPPNTSPADTTPPTATLNTPAANATISGTAVSLLASASDTVGVTRVEFFMDDTLLGSDTTSPYSFSLNSTLYPNSSHSLQVKAYDAAGNVGSSTTVSVAINNVVPDTTAPTVSIQAPLSGSTISGSSYLISASAVDEAGGSGVARVEFYVDGSTTAIGSDTTAPYSFSLNTTTLSNASHSLQVKATDIAGNSRSMSVSFTVNNTVATPKKADFNNDGLVNSKDLFILLGNFGKTVPANTLGDTNGDGLVNSMDLFNLLGLYGK